jgi:cytochrome c peroxidase
MTPVFGRLGGNFWDGRVPDLAKQGLQPPINPNEMANTPEGPYTPANGGYSPLLVKKLSNRPYTELFKRVYGQDVFRVYTPKQIYELFGEALAAYQSSGAYFGQAQCFPCHSSAAVPAIQMTTQGKDTFTMYCHASRKIWVILITSRPTRNQTLMGKTLSEPSVLTTVWVLTPIRHPMAPDSTRVFRVDIREFRGPFKTPSMRGADKRPSPDFVKAYMPNGVFKSLKDVVHFYNKRNIAVDAAGKEIAFDLRKHPPSGNTPLFPPPEVLDNVQNVRGSDTLPVDFRN